MIMRIRDPKTTALVFASGKMVITGARSKEEAQLGGRKYARLIQKLGNPAKFKDFKVQNMVGSCDVKFPIRLEGLAFAHTHYASVSEFTNEFLTQLDDFLKINNSMSPNCFQVLFIGWFSQKSFF